MAERLGATAICNTCFILFLALFCFLERYLCLGKIKYFFEKPDQVLNTWRTNVS